MYNATKMTRLKAEMKRRGLILSLKGLSYENALTVAKTAMTCGIRTFEVSLKTPYSGKLLSLLRQELGEDAIVGAGDVFCSPTSAHDVIYAYQQGAMFVDAPVWFDTFADTARVYDFVAISGADTLAEIYKVHKYSSTFVRLALSSSVTTAGIQEIRSLIDHVSLCMYGDLEPERLQEYIRAGLNLYVLDSRKVCELAENERMEELKLYLSEYQKLFSGNSDNEKLS